MPEISSLNQLIAIRLAALIAMYAMIRTLHRWAYAYALIWWPGTVAHELSHFFIGLILGANPARLTVLPRYNESTGELVLGEVIFSNLRWWNKLPVGIAPLIVLAPIGALLVYKSLSLTQVSMEALLLEFGALQCFVGCWPSPTDWAHARTTLYVVTGIALLSWGIYALFIR
jgi:hypothetical protein